MISRPGLKIIGGTDPGWIRRQQDQPDSGQPDLAGITLRSSQDRPPIPQLSNSAHSRDLIAKKYAPDSQIGSIKEETCIR